MATYLFGGGVVQSAQIQYISYLNITENLTLSWPSSFLDSTNVVAIQMDISTVSTGLVVTMPSAEEVGVGTSFFFNNLGTTSIIVNDNDGDLITTVVASSIVYFYLIDNSTAAGVWRIFVFGAGTSTAQAQELAGYGLIALSNGVNPDNLNVEVDILSVGEDTTIDATSRSAFYICTAGLDFTVGTGLEPGLFFYATNQGVGIVNIIPSLCTINGSSDTISFLPGQSVWLTTDGINWYTFGNNQQSPVLASILNFPLENGVYTYSIPDADIATNNVIVFDGSNDGVCAVTFDPLDGEWIFQNICTFNVTIRFTGVGTTYTLLPQNTIYLYGNSGLSNLFNVPSFNSIAPSRTAGDMIYRGSITNQALAIATGDNLGAALVADDTGGAPRPGWNGMGTLSVCTVQTSAGASYPYVATPITVQLLTLTTTKKIVSSNIVITGSVCIGQPATASTIVSVALINTVNGGAPNTLAFVASLGGNASNLTLTTVPINFVDSTVYAAGDVLVYYIEVYFAATGTLGINQPAAGAPSLGPTTSTMTLMEVGNLGSWNV